MSTGRTKLIEDIVRENMSTLSQLRAQSLLKRSSQDKIADGITTWSGSIAFVWLHLVWFLGWIVVNVGWTPWHAFDPFPFGLLTMIVSLEAIFLSTFVLISQNRASKENEERANLDLQINLLTERELTKLICIVDAIAEKIGAKDAIDAEVKAMEHRITITEMIDELHRTSPTKASDPASR